MSNIRLENLPTEIIYMIFDYLSPHHILHAFLNINSLFNGMLSNYHNYKLNFKSISRAQFDLVYHHINPNQVVSLTLSDLEDTPDLSALFFRSFRLADFNRLRMLKLIIIENESWTNILPYLQTNNNRPQLSIELLTENQVFPMEVFLYTTQIRIDTIEQLVSHYISLQNHCTISQCLVILRCLTVSQCSVFELRLISIVAIELLSLKVENLILMPNEELLLRTKKLRRLVLNCYNTSISMNQMEQLLLNLPQLKYFEISAQGSLDLIDGRLWERLTQQLITLNFNFWIVINPTEGVLDSFSTPFWIEKKKWFVAYTWCRLFSIPHFFDKSADAHFQLPLYTTMPDADKSSLLDKVNHFILNDSSNVHQNYFRYIKTLEIRNADLFETLSTAIDFNQVENLILSSSINHSTILSLRKSLPLLQQFSVNTKLEDFLNQTNNLSFEHIRILEIDQPIVNGNFYIIEQLVRLFPNIEILRVDSIQWGKGVARFLDRFENLWSASFRFERSVRSVTVVDTWEVIRREIHPEKYEAFHHRRTRIPIIDQNQVEYYDFWIKKQKFKSLSNRYRLPERGYRYYHHDNYIQNSLFLQPLFFALFASEVYFSLTNCIHSSISPWQILPIQILILATNNTKRVYRDPLISKLIQLLTYVLVVWIIYRVDQNSNSLFCYNLYRFLYDPSIFTFDKDHLLGSFYQFFGIWVLGCMGKFHSIKRSINVDNVLVKASITFLVLINIHFSLEFLFP